MESRSSVAGAPPASGIAAEVSLDGVRAAREVVYRTIEPTPIRSYPLLDEAAGMRLWLKHENYLPTGAFKIRGGLNFMHHFAAARTHDGVISATRGNHGQSVALAAGIYDVPATIVVPYGNNPEKNSAMRGYGARLIEFGRDFDEAREEVERIARAENLRYVHSADEPHLVNGVGTYALEIVDTLEARGQQLDAIFVPIGMGSGLSGVITVFRALSPKTRIYGVQAEGAPSVFLSWRAGRVVTTPNANTMADGVATRVPSPFTLDIILKGVDEVVLVTDSEIIRAIRLLWRTTHNLVEGAGACATAAALNMKERFEGQNVACVLTGGNLDTATLSGIFRT